MKTRSLELFLVSVLAFSSLGIEGYAPRVFDASLSANVDSGASVLFTAPEETVFVPFAPFSKPVPIEDQHASPIYFFGNPAGCSTSAPDGSPQQMLENVQANLGSSFDLKEHRVEYIWNGPRNSMVNATDDPFAYEFSVNPFQYPLTYKADQIATTFMVNGFVVWFREYDGDFRMLAIPMTAGVLESPWAEYVRSYWQSDGVMDDGYIVPMTRKLPCRWAIDEGYAHEEDLLTTFNFDWQVPDYLFAGDKYLASNCKEANRVAREMIHYWDAASMCGPLTWQIMKDANGFPYRIGNWYADARIFMDANPMWNGRPWLGFDPETYDVFHTDTPLPGYDFANNFQLEAGDIVYSYSTLYQSTDERFDHIFLVAGVDENGARLSITNMVQSRPVFDCFIREVVLYYPGDTVNGVINKEWNSYDYGRTGVMGFDVFRWKWQTYHLEGRSREYVVRVGDTIETIAFDWKISPESLILKNQLDIDGQLTPGQVIVLPAP